MADNSFNANVGSLFHGMEGFITGHRWQAKDE